MNVAKNWLIVSLLSTLLVPALAADKGLSTYFPPTEDKGGWRSLLPESGEPDAAPRFA